MRKIAIFIENSSINDVDLSDIDKGNPGIGGTEYLMFMLAKMLTEADNGLDVALYLEKEQRLLESINCKVCGTMQNAILESETLGCNYLILKHNASHIKNDSLHTENDLKLIVWCHVFICFWELDYYASNSDVARIVYVGREHLQLNADHPSFGKSTYIYNFVDSSSCRDKVAKHPFERRKHIVTYLGSLVPFKGFHLLAEAWPHVVAKVPDAELFVIGSGKVYDSSASLGYLGVASKKYEDFFLPYLSRKGAIAPNVHFMGRMGAEKEEILLRTKVGVPNPTGITETFCLSAVEMQMRGATIATIKAPGYIDTVKNGILYNNPRQLAKSIVKLLESNTSQYDEAMSYFEKEFSKQAALKRWEDLLWDKEIKKDRVLNKGYRLKWLKLILGRLKEKYPFSVKLPNIERILVFVERKVLHKNSFMDSNLKL